MNTEHWKSLGLTAAIIGSALVCGLLANKCSNPLSQNVSAVNISPETIEAGRADWHKCVYLFTDPETKVQYIYFMSMGKAGICPRYTAEGGFYIEK